jgi:hypothetical protein
VLSNEEKVWEIVKDLVPKLTSWCDDGVFKTKLQNIGNVIKDMESILEVLPYEKVDPQLLNMINFPKETNTFSLFCDNQNIEGYAQLGYSFVDKLPKCPNIKYVATSWTKLKEIVKGRFGLLRSRYTEIILNSVNVRYPNGTLIEELNRCFDDLAEAVVWYRNKNPKLSWDLTIQKDHFEPFPHPDSDNSDDEDNQQPKLSSTIMLPNNIEFSHRVDLKCLLPNNRINDNVVNGYVFEIQKLYKNSSECIICNNTLLYNGVEENRTWSNECWLRWTNIYTVEHVQAAKYYIYPIYHEHHWVWFAANKNIKYVKVVCFDSLSVSKKITGWKKKCAEFIENNVYEIDRTILKDPKNIDKALTEWIHHDTYPQQPDVINCGLYMLLGIELFLKAKDKNTKFEFTIHDVLEYKARIRKHFRDELIKDYNNRNKHNLSDFN